jgi:hypothetical protein
MQHAVFKTKEKQIVESSQQLLGLLCTIYDGTLTIDNSPLKNIYSVSTLKKLPKKSA